MARFNRRGRYRRSRRRTHRAFYSGKKVFLGMTMGTLALVGVGLYFMWGTVYGIVNPILSPILSKIGIALPVPSTSTTNALI